MTDDARRLLGVGLAAAVLFTALAVAVPRLFGAAAGPEVEILTALKTEEARGIELDVGLAQPLRSKRVGYQRMSVVVTGERAVVTATLDFDGTVNETAVSSLGLERIGFRLEGGDWVPEAGWAPQLVGVVRALEKRRAALEAGDVTGLCSGRADSGEASEVAELLAVEGRKVRALNWLIRSEREDVLVTEESRVTGTLPSRPVDDLKTTRLTLQGAAGGEFCFPDGLM
ncbi:MAG: hypothetical protein JNK82_34740 [Myxococcaceae bacterium]|nr:hypothetical protein [Myxococcaceae bacterium]